MYTQFFRSTLTSADALAVGFSRYRPIPSWPSEFWPQANTSPSCVKKRVWYLPQAICFILMWSNIFSLVSGTNMCCRMRTSVKYSAATSVSTSLAWSDSGLSWNSRAYYFVNAPSPSWPYSPEPQAKTLSASVANIECFDPAEISKTISSRNCVTKVGLSTYAILIPLKFKLWKASWFEDIPPDLPPIAYIWYWFSIVLFCRRQLPAVRAFWLMRLKSSPRAPYLAWPHEKT